MDRATRMMINEFGADVLISKPSMKPSTPIQRIVNRNRANKRVNELDPQQGVAYEYPADGAAATVVCLWDQPRRRTHEARAIVRRSLSRYQIHDDEVAHVWAVGRGQDHPPLRSELAEWRECVIQGIQAAHCEHVILMGGPVCSLWWTKAKITRVAGSAYVWPEVNAYVYPAYNPLALKHDMDLSEYMKSFGRLSWGIYEDTILTGLDLNCHEPNCERDAVVYDERAMGWCDSHFSVPKAKNQEKKWKKESAKTNQLGLL